MQISLQRRFDELIDAFQQRPLMGKEKKVIMIACNSRILSKQMDHFPKTDFHDAVLVSRLRQFLCPHILSLTLYSAEHIDRQAIQTVERLKE